MYSQYKTMHVRVGHGTTQCRVNAFEQWCYRRILKLKWTDKVTNAEVLERLQTSMHFLCKSKVFGVFHSEGCLGADLHSPSA